MTNLETLEQQFIDLGAKLKRAHEELDRLKNGWEMKCPYKKGDDYYLLKNFGDFQKMEWTNHLFDELALIQGNIFTNEEAVNLEVKRRKLLTRFRAFRNECNGDWKVDWNDKDERKWCFYYSIPDDIFSIYYSIWNQQFALFGYFKNDSDCERAIELFGDEIKELFVEKRLANENN